MKVLIVAVVAACSSPPAKPVATSQPTGIAVADIDRKADPCRDFYDYANGAWRAANPIPKDQPRWGRRAVAREANRKAVRDLLVEVSAKKAWPTGSTEQLAGDLFASCVAEPSGLAPLQPLLGEIAAVQTPAELQRAIRHLHALGISVPFGTIGSFDNADPTHYLENVVAGTSGLDRAHIVKLLETEAGVDAVVALESRLAAAALDEKSAADPALTEHLMSVAQLVALAPRIDWATYVSDAKLAPVELNVTDPKLLAEINKELADTPLATWKLYLQYHLLDVATPWLAKDPEPATRASRCAELTESLLPEAVGKKYVERYFPPAAKAQARHIADALVEVITATLAKEAWMEPSTRQRALAKIRASRVEIGYPDHWASYAGVVVHRDTLWANIAQLRAFAVADDRRQVGKPTDRGSWKLPPSSPLAYIDLQINELVLPAGFLQAPVFDPQASAAVNFGAMGSGLAHDLMHAVDATGAAYTIDGKPMKWWTETDEAEFAKRTACVRDEYASYAIEPDLHEDGKLVLDEAVGDLVGLRVAYAALQREPKPVIDGFTAGQQFFLAWGQLRGEAMGIEAQRKLVKSDIHPVPALRVNGPLVNLPEFAQAFACKPVEPRCTVW